LLEINHPALSPQVVIGHEKLRQPGLGPHAHWVCTDHGQRPQLAMLYMDGEAYMVCQLCIVERCDITYAKTLGTP
jgi:hypothetical protein